MHTLNHFYAKTLKFDLLNKFYYTNLKKLPKLKKIILNFNCKTTDLKTLSTHLLALELVTHQKGVLTVSKHPNLFLKIRKGNPIGCKVILKKTSVLKFLSKSLNEIFPKTKNFDAVIVDRKKKDTNFSFAIKDNLNFPELSENYYLFNDLSDLNLSIVTTAKTKKETTFLLKSLQIPLRS